MTLARYLAFSALDQAVKETDRLVRITDPFLSPTANRVLAEEGFVHGQDGWMKLTLRAILPCCLLVERLAAILRAVPPSYWSLHQLPQLLSRLDPAHDIGTLVEVERVLWPAKVADTRIPNFIVPVKPAWAQHLFDARLARGTLFGADPQLALRRECVYYRSVHWTGGIVAPARVLWYVSRGDGRRAGEIRACSYLDEVIIAPASDIYRTYRRYGTYTWNDLLETAGNDPDKDVMALRFRDTELLASPVPWGGWLRDVLGRSAPLRSPVVTDASAFTRIYTAATLTGV